MRTSIEESLKRVDQAELLSKKRIIELLQKKKSQEEKGNSQFMRRNKKNFGDNSEWKLAVNSKKYELYKTENDTKRNYQST